MRILVLSDTHGKIGKVIKLLKGKHGFDRIIHLGDLVSDAIDLEAIADIPVDYVAGNCDWSSGAAPNEKILEVSGKRIFLCHGHGQQVKYGEDVLKQIIQDKSYDMALYGHTHHASVTYENESIIMNPGSISLPRDGHPSYGVINIDPKGVIHTNIVRIKKH